MANIICPRCRWNITVNECSIDGSREASHTQRYGAQRIYRCNNRDCGTFFIKELPLNGQSYVFHPTNFTEYDFTPYPNLTTLSPSFKEYYNQAYKVEQFGQKDIAGPGYRKALEFLIKDYVISGNPDKSEQIGEMNLQSCINTYISDEDIKQISTRAYWLGNDQTHYYKRWEAHDIDSLKELIELTIHFLEKKIRAQKIIADMPAS